MSIEQIIDELKGMEEGTDAEIAHSKADELLLDLLVELGRGDVVNAYRKARDRVGFWYA